LAAAHERQALEKAAKDARDSIARLRAEGAGEGRLADVQAHVLARWLSNMQGWAVSAGTVQFGLAMMLAAVFEAVTAFGLALSLGRHGIARPPAGEAVEEEEKGTAAVAARRSSSPRPAQSSLSGGPTRVTRPGAKRRGCRRCRKKPSWPRSAQRRKRGG
jgi:hypothetical protein